MRIPVRIIDREDLFPEMDGQGRRSSRPDPARPPYFHEPDEEAETLKTEKEPEAYEGGPDREEEIGSEHDNDDKGSCQQAQNGGWQERGYARDELGTGDEPLGWEERYVRLKADFANYKRHAEAEKERLTGLGKEAVLEDLFVLLEHMERAIKAADDADDRTGIREGLAMVYQELLCVLEKHGAKRIVTEGQAFDPKLHEAVAVVSRPDAPGGTIVEEVRPGFTRDERLLRPASVVVAR